MPVLLFALAGLIVDLSPGLVDEAPLNAGMRFMQIHKMAIATLYNPEVEQEFGVEGETVRGESEEELDIRVYGQPF